MLTSFLRAKTSGHIARSFLPFFYVLTFAFPTIASASQTTAPRGALLDVPYLSQTEQLCGGAAVAMVLRYWGDPSIVPQDFTPFVERAAGGIRTTVLTRVITERGWRATTFTSRGARTDLLSTHLAEGRPVIALIEDRPSVYHYVVIVGATNDTVVLHDPARSPYRVMSKVEFDRRSSAAGGWMLLILPSENAPTTPGRTAAPSTAAIDAQPVVPPTACSVIVDRSVAEAETGDLGGAERGLLDAVVRCPEDAAVWRELAGLRFVQKRYAESSDLARRAIGLTPEDRDARQLLGTTLYMREDLVGALAVWNHIDQPRIDIITVDGLQHTRVPIAIGVTGLRPRALLTPEAFRLAERRLAELPSASATGLRYRPIASGAVVAEATVVERPVLPNGALAWATVGIASAFRREARLDVVSPSGDGEVWTGAYRWAKNRPRVRFGLSVPQIAGLPAFVDLDAMWERQSYASPNVDGDPIREERRRGGARFSNWATSWLRWQGGGAVDRFGDRHYVSVDGRGIARGFDDRIAGIVGASHWFSTSGSAAFSTTEAAAAWRTTRRNNLPVWSGRVGITRATADAPLAVWPVAGSSDGRGVFLRGHTLFDDGVITTAVIGRTLAFANVEYSHPAYSSPYTSMNIAGFADVARATRRMEGLDDTPLHVDIGAGLRVTTPSLGGQVRIDIAIGLRDHTKKFSAGYVVPWGR